MFRRVFSGLCLIALLASWSAPSARAQTTVRPYKFGFTVDEQQHRSEQRDERGIVMGEFGFITADGIYHVTVYATDEEGKFRILAMRSYPYEANPKTVEMVVVPKPKAPEAPKKELPKFNFNTMACSGCFLKNDAPPTKAPALVTTKPKSQIQTLSRPLARIAPASVRPPTGALMSVPQRVLAEKALMTVLSDVALSGRLEGPVRSNVAYGMEHVKTVFRMTDATKKHHDEQKLPKQTQRAPSAAPHAHNQAGSSRPAHFPTPAQTHEHDHHEHEASAPAGVAAHQQHPTPAPQHRPSQQDTKQTSHTHTPASSSHTPLTRTQTGNKVVPSGQKPNQGSSKGTSVGGQGKTGTAAIPLLPPVGSTRPKVSSSGAGNKAAAPVAAGSFKDSFKPQTTGPGSSGGGAGGAGGDGGASAGRPKGSPSPSRGGSGSAGGFKAGGGASGAGAQGGDLYRFKYRLDYNGHQETGSRNGNKVGSYVVIGDDNIERTLEYIANENGYYPKIKWRKLQTPPASKENTLQESEFVWFKE